MRRRNEARMFSPSKIREQNNTRIQVSVPEAAGLSLAGGMECSNDASGVVSGVSLGVSIFFLIFVVQDSFNPVGSETVCRLLIRVNKLMQCDR